MATFGGELRVAAHLEDTRKLIAMGSGYMDADGLGDKGPEIMPPQPRVIAGRGGTLKKPVRPGLAIGDAVIAHGLRLRAGDDALVDACL